MGLELYHIFDMIFAILMDFSTFLLWWAIRYIFITELQRGMRTGNEVVRIKGNEFSVYIEIWKTDCLIHRKMVKDMTTLEERRKHYKSIFELMNRVCH